jgi:hypothetical protein
MCQPPPSGVLSAARMQPARARRQWKARGHGLDVHLEDISSFVQSGVSDSVVGDGISPSKEGWSKVCRIVSDVGRRSMHACVTGAAQRSALRRGVGVSLGARGAQVLGAASGWLLCVGHALSVHQVGHPRHGVSKWYSRFETGLISACGTHGRCGCGGRNIIQYSATHPPETLIQR